MRTSVVNMGGPVGGACVAAGYSDGTIRIFRLASGEMERKLRPHGTPVTALQYSAHGHVILSAGKNGLVAVSNPETGDTCKQFGLEGDELWLAASSDRRVSVWAADWPKIKCDLLDWLTFPAPAYNGEAETPPPSLAAFCPTDPGLVVYSSYAVEKEVCFYSLARKRSLSSGSPDRCGLQSGRFQNFLPHSDGLQACRFSPSGGLLFSLAHDEVYLWQAKGLQQPMNHT
ncbi:hypothetical protein CRUP_025797 [Coryphaenoides rupestris]|nr:hypothetical protein CRUP_025797 [Coryphaenoides rupestris]